MLKQKQKQKLTHKLSPQQIQLMKLIQLPDIELETRIKNELQENPTLEEEQKEENPPENELEKDFEKILKDSTEYSSSSSSRLRADDLLRYADYNDDKTLYERLKDQIQFLSLTDSEQTVAEYIIGNLDDSGYFSEDIQSAIDNLLFSFNVEITQKVFEAVLEKVKKLEPVGIASRSLHECLLAQLNEKKKGIVTRTAIEIVTKYFEEFTKKHYPSLAKKLGVTNEELEGALASIHKLNPKPGKTLENQRKRTQYVTADFIITRKGDDFEVSMPKSRVPELTINREYKNMLEGYVEQKGQQTKQQKSTATFIRQKLNSALWFIDAIKQRQETLLKTIKGILEYQKEYFLSEGDAQFLKPMILKNIADLVSLDQSTISRVVNSKYVQTDFGFFKLKHFFSESLTTEAGEEVSSKAIKQILSDLIANETKAKPYSDLAISKKLKENGYLVARRTVAKYREQMNIPVSRLRKEVQ